MCRLEGEAEKIVAVLHDVVEDTEWTLADLRCRGFPEHILQALDCLTKRKGQRYEDFVSRSASNPLARRVKLADLEDNMDIRRLEAVKLKDVPRLNRYLGAWRRLQLEP